MLRAQADGLKMRQIAPLFWEPSRVEAEWEDGGWMHYQLKRRARRGREIMKRYREIAAGCDAPAPALRAA